MIVVSCEGKKSGRKKKEELDKERAWKRQADINTESQRNRQTEELTV